jgi:hypothetical protein
MYNQGELARGATLVVCGREYAFDRSLDMLRRAEGAIGAVAPFAQRLDVGAATSDEIVRVYVALLRDRAGAPQREILDAWVWEEGVRAHQALAVYLYSLTMGSKELRRVLDERRVDEEPARDDARGPFAKTAGQTGITSWGSGESLDGRPPSSGAPRFTR